MRTIISGYRPDQLLHRNAEHDVWLARAPDGGAPVVVKRCARAGDPQRSRSLLREGDVLARLSHSNVIELIGMVDDPPGHMLVMAPIAGGSLRDLLDEQGTLTAGAVVAVLDGVADAVGYLAGLGLIHGALRPDHVLLAADGHPVLIGFGAITDISCVPAGAHAVGRPPVAEGPSPRVFDDPTYLHPAVATGEVPHARAEVFSLGVMAYECLTGRAPHRGTSAEVVALAAAGVHRPLSSWSSVPDEVAGVVEQALDLDDPEAPVDAATFVSRLRAVTDPATVIRPRPRIDVTHTLLSPAPGETLPFGPTPPVVIDTPVAPEAWRVAVAAVIATLVAVALWFVAGVLLGV